MKFFYLINIFSETSYSSKPKPPAIQLHYRQRSGRHPTKPFFQKVDVECPSRVQLLRGAFLKKIIHTISNFLATVSLVKRALWIILFDENFAQWPHFEKNSSKSKKRRTFQKCSKIIKKIYRSN